MHQKQPERSAAMPNYYYRIDVMGTTLVKFKAATVAYNLMTRRKGIIGKRIAGSVAGPPSDDKVARQQLHAISAYKHFRVEVGPNDIDAHALHLLFQMEQSGITSKMMIELVPVTYTWVKNRATNPVASGPPLAVMMFNAKVTGHVVVSLPQDGYSFNFKIIGGTETDETE